MAFSSPFSYLERLLEEGPFSYLEWRHRALSGQSRRELRVVLLGNIGSGKSASGNTLLGRSGFTCRLSASPITQQCEAQTVDLGDPGTRGLRWVTVVDTPGLTAEMLTDTGKEKLLQRCLQLSSPGPHVFLLVIPLGRFTQEEKDTVERAVEVFGSRLYTFTIILFTFKDNLKDNSIEEYISTAGESLQQLVQKCGSRYHSFNNNSPGENDQAEQLIVKMDKLVEDNRRTCYTNDDEDSDIWRRHEEEWIRVECPFPVPLLRPFSYLVKPKSKEDVLKEEFEKCKIQGVTKENLRKQAEILEKLKEQLESRERQLNEREEQIRKQEEELEEKKKKLKEHLVKLSEDL
ncbi:GTPase IMAP family member 9-like isoform X2 [Salminus brasiliensis]|uniref:GTPase IMAP family member 9-like isoform X2 n=1 Tax=Salminus brasiliensis TaxID=930266 RepID=UPI003B836823